MNKEQKYQQLIKELIDKMFEISGHPLKFENVKDRKDNWFQEYTMTEEQNKEWREWGIKHIKNKTRLSKKIAELEMAWLDLYCGLKIHPPKKF